MSKNPSRPERDHRAFEYGTDAEYREWLTYQPSCLSGEFGEYHNGEGRNVAAHVRTVNAGAGVGTKPAYSCVPLADAEHRLTHQHGNGHCRQPEWWGGQAENHLRRWAKTRGGGIIRGRVRVDV